MPTFRDDLHLGHSVPMVDTEDIVDGAVTEPKLADDSVSTRTIQDGAVTEPKIAEKAVTEPKLADAAVSTRTIKFRAVTESKIGDSAVSTRTIQNGAVTNPKIANGAVSMNKLDNETQTLIQRGADSSWTPMGDYDVDALYYANDLVFDPETNSSYLSLRADNMGHAVTDETWWMKVVDGSYVNRAIEEMEAAIAQAIEDAQEDIDDAIAGANTAAQTANTAAANAEAKIDWVEEQVDSLTAYEVATALDETSIIPVQNKVVSKEINNANAYLKTDVRTLAVGQAYALDEAVKTADGKMLRMTKEIIGFTTSAVFNINDLVYYSGSTYQSLISVQLYDSTHTYAEGDYAVKDGVISIYDGESWTAADRATMLADTSLFTQVDAAWLAANAAVQNSVTEDIFNATNILHKKFDLTSANVTTNNTLYITPEKTSDGAKWTIASVDAVTSRQAQVSIPKLVAGKTYRVSFNFANTINATIVVALDAFSSEGTDGRITTAARQWLSGDLTASGNNGTFKIFITAGYSDIEYVCFRFTQPTKNRYLQISNIQVTEVIAVTDRVDDIDDYIYNKKSQLVLGNLYDKGDEVFTDSQEIKKINRDILLMNLNDEVKVGDLKVYGSNTYKALKSILNYDSATEYSSGDYSIKDGVVKKYNDDTWSAVTLANLVADTAMYEQLTIDGLLAYVVDGNVPKLYNGFGLNTDGAITQSCLFYELNDFTSLSFPAVRTGRKVDGAEGKWSNGSTHKYYLFPVEHGQVYRIVANTEHYANYAWFTDIPTSQTSGGTPPYAPGYSNQAWVSEGTSADVQVPKGARYMYIFGEMSNGDVYKPTSVSLAAPIVGNSAARLNTLEKGTPYTLPRLLKLARYRRDDTNNISILHYSDLHADTVAFAELQEFYKEYGGKFDAVLETGDRTYTVATGTALNLADEVLFVPGNHDVCNGSGTAGYSWPAYTPEYLFNKFVAPYKDARGITLPEGWNVEGDPHQNALYWYKDFDNGLDKVRLIGIDCMRYYHMNENDPEFDNDAQEKWLCDTLADAQANGFKVIVASHYSLDDYSGAYAKWDEENHTWKYNYVNDPVSNTGGHVMNRMTNTPVGFHNRTTTSFTSSNTQHLRNRTARNNKGNINNFGDIITAWIEGGSAFNNYITFQGGGTFIAWICGHLHNNIMFYPTRYPKILNIVTTCVGTTMWGYNTDTPIVNRREDTVYHRLSANAYFIQGNYLKIVRIGNNLTNDLLVPSTWMTINYVTGEVITEG